MSSLPRYEIWAMYRFNLFNASGGTGWLIRSPKGSVLREGSAFVPRMPQECREQGPQILAYMAMNHAFQQLRSNSLVILHLSSCDVKAWNCISKGKLDREDRGCRLLSNAFQAAVEATDRTKAIRVVQKSEKSPFMKKSFLLAQEACRAGQLNHTRLSKKAPYDCTTFIVGPAAESSFDGLYPII